ncbi:MAG: fructose-6-phosphate aldolase [Candidatus Omnitrophica bacterium]|nr:fructose-6-phosphate aldolase [Candidatus Omnitrophota bacterium]MCM8797873.1 fructose-6-phosphate aldolase [Candidatus Omnitrophota bacterium]
MQLFIDSANLEEIREVSRWGIIDGVTTNPTLIAKEGKDFRQLIKEICEIVDGPISVEAISMQGGEIIKEARGLSRIHKNIVVKIPLTKEGLKAVKVLSKEGIKTNVTLCFSATQALLSAKAGANFVSPFVGRLDDISGRGMDLVREICTIFHNYHFPTQVIVASVRHPLHVLEAALLGADIATCPFPVLEQLLKHPLTDIGIKRFLEDWEKIPKKRDKRPR